MHLKFCSLLFCFLITKALAAQLNHKILLSTKKQIDYSVAEQRSIWTISPEVKPDVLKVTGGRNNGVKVVFKSDLDSSVYYIKEKDTVQFIIVFNQDTAYTQIIGTPRNVNFTERYINEHKDKFDIHIPEVQELVKVIIALSKVGSTDSNMTNMRGVYYQEVKNHFSPFKNHPLLDTINKYIKDKGADSYWHYYAWKLNANAYSFTREGNIVNNNIIKKMGFGFPDDPFLTWTEQVEDFAKKSNFRKFYQLHRSFYQSSIQDFEQYNPVRQMKTWLEAQFPNKYDYYVVSFSPLAGGAHATQHFDDNGFSQTIMFISPTRIDTSVDKAVNVMNNSRMVFTEIDHNYVNPISDLYRPEIDSAFRKAMFWKTDWASKMYDNPTRIFNEYMTWAVFSLYCLEFYKGKDVLTFLEMHEKMMEEGRGFKNFKMFNRQLIDIFIKKPKSKKVADLYPAILSWCIAKLQG